MTYFVWVDSLRGPAPELWADEPIDGNGNGKSTKNALHKHKLSLEEEKLTFDQLIEHFKNDIR